MSGINMNVERMSGIDGQTFAKQNFVQLKVDAVHWKVLWQNPKTGEYWKEYFPQPETQGGGPSEFVKITVQEAKMEFGSW